jgi:hypothetical protein
MAIFDLLFSIFVCCKSVRQFLARLPSCFEYLSMNGIFQAFQIPLRSSRVSKD